MVAARSAMGSWRSRSTAVQMSARSYPSRPRTGTGHCRGHPASSESGATWLPIAHRAEMVSSRGSSRRARTTGSGPGRGRAWLPQLPPGWPRPRRTCGATRGPPPARTWLRAASPRRGPPGPARRRWRRWAPLSGDIVEQLERRAAGQGPEAGCQQWAHEPRPPWCDRARPPGVGERPVEHVVGRTRQRAQFTAPHDLRLLPGACRSARRTGPRGEGRTCSRRAPGPARRPSRRPTGCCPPRARARTPG